MKKNCGVSYKYIVCMYIGMCAWVFPFIWKWRFASLKLHSCFKESEDTCFFFYYFTSVLRSSWSLISFVIQECICKMESRSKMCRTALSVRATQWAASKGAHTCNLYWDINILVQGLLLSKPILTCQKLSYILNGFIIRIWLLF